MNLQKLAANKDLQTRISKLNYYTTENFINDAKAYIQAIEQGRMVCIIGSVSNSGMSRTMKFSSCEKSKTQKNSYYRSYNCLFVALGYNEANRSGYLKIGGCGMDMIFATNYNNIHRLHNLGFINKIKCAKLAQMTPTNL